MTFKSLDALREYINNDILSPAGARIKEREPQSHEHSLPLDHPTDQVEEYKVWKCGNATGVIEDHGVVHESHMNGTNIGYQKKMEMVLNAEVRWYIECIELHEWLCMISDKSHPAYLAEIDDDIRHRHWDAIGEGLNLQVCSLNRLKEMVK